VKRWKRENLGKHRGGKSSSTSWGVEETMSERRLLGMKQEDNHPRNGGDGSPSVKKGEIVKAGGGEKARQELRQHTLKGRGF